jgi:hypothetical protein
MPTEPVIYAQENSAPQTATELERFSQSLQDQDVHALVSYMEDLARRQPVAFIGSVALLGFLASHALQGSAEG